MNSPIGKCQCNIASVNHIAHGCQNRASEFRRRNGITLALCSSCTLTGDEELPGLPDDERKIQIELSKGV